MGGKKKLKTYHHIIFDDAAKFLNRITEPRSNKDYIKISWRVIYYDDTAPFLPDPFGSVCARRNIPGTEHRDNRCTHHVKAREWMNGSDYTVKSDIANH